MSKNLNYEKLLQKKIKQVLLKEWDPIGIQDVSEAQDEYDNYIFPLYELLVSGKTEREVFDYLWWIKTEHMGLSGNRKNTEVISKKLYALID